MAFEAHDLTSMQPGTVQAYGEIIKLLIINPIVGGIVAVVSTVAVVYLKKNTAATKTNTEKTETSSEVHATLQKEINDATEKIQKLVNRFSETVGSAESKILGEVDKIKIVVAKIGITAQSTEKQLSMIPKVQDALDKRLAALEHEQEIVAANSSVIIEGLRKLAQEKKP